MTFDNQGFTSVPLGTGPACPLHGCAPAGWIDGQYQYPCGCSGPRPFPSTPVLPIEDQIDRSLRPHGCEECVEKAKTIEGLQRGIYKRSETLDGIDTVLANYRNCGELRVETVRRLVKEIETAYDKGLTDGRSDR